MSSPDDTTAPASDALVQRPVTTPSVASVLGSPEPVAPPRRSRRAWVIGGVVLAALVLAGAGVAAFLLLTPTAQRTPADAVLDYDRAYADVDCELYTAVTTEAYRERLAPTCADFEAEAQAFVEAFSDYEVVVESTTVDGETATVVTSESWELEGEQNSADYTYALVRVDGTWKIDALE